MSTSSAADEVAEKDSNTSAGLFGDSDLPGRTLSLSPTQAGDIGPLWQRLKEDGNARLFKQVYKSQCASQQDLKTTLLVSTNDGSMRRITYTVNLHAAKSPIGWTVLDLSVSTPELISCAVFVPPLHGEETSAEVVAILCTLGVEELGYQRLEFRVGSFDKEPGLIARKIGMSFLGISYGS